MLLRDRERKRENEEERAMCVCVCDVLLCYSHSLHLKFIEFHKYMAIWAKIYAICNEYVDAYYTDECMQMSIKFLKQISHTHEYTHLQTVCTQNSMEKEEKRAKES